MGLKILQQGMSTGWSAAVDWQAEHRLLEGAAHSHVTSVESLDRMAAWHSELLECVAQNRGLTGEVLHRIVTEYEKGDSDWGAELSVGMHPNVHSATLQVLADTIDRRFPTDRQLAYDSGAPGYTEGLYGPFDVLVAVMCHRETLEDARRVLERRFQAAMKFRSSGSQYDIEREADEIIKLMSDHENSCSHAVGRTRHFLTELRTVGE